MQPPGLKGEHQLQEELGTTRRAQAFYKQQMLDYLNPSMREFISSQQMVFIATSDSKGECDCSFRMGPPVLSTSWTVKHLRIPSTEAMGY